MSRKRRSHGNPIGASVPAGMLTVAQFAKRVGVSADTVRRWVRNGAIKPASSQKRGKLDIRLFSEEQVTYGKAIAKQTGHMARRVLAS